MEVVNDKLNTLIERLENIAKKNNDKFIYNIEINKTKRGLLFTFTCKETADGHIFIEGSKYDLFECLDDADKEITMSLSCWGYHE